MKTMFKICVAANILFALYSCSTDDLVIEEKPVTFKKKTFDFDEMMRESDSNESVKDSVSKEREYEPPFIRPTR